LSSFVLRSSLPLLSARLYDTAPNWISYPIIAYFDFFYSSFPRWILTAIAEYQTREVNKRMSSSLNLEEQKQKIQEFAANAQEKLQEMNVKTKESMENARYQLLTYGNQIQEYLNKIHAEVTNYKFLIEKKGNDTLVDIQFKASVKQKTTD
jgi:hypothetical protein